MPYGVSSTIWATLPPDDQNELIKEYLAAQGQTSTQPTIGGYVQPTQQQVSGALAQSGLPPATQTSVQQSYNQQAAQPTTSGVPNPGWVYAVNMPSTYPDYAAMKQAGSGLVVDLNNPNAALLVSEAKKWGVQVAIQVGAGAAGDLTPEQYAAKVQQAQAMGADRLVLDIEGAGKGVQGSDGWNWSQQAAALLKPVVGNTAVSVTMEPHQDDYNYAAYKDLSASGPTQFWVQAYQGDMTAVDPTWAASSAKAAVGGDSVVTIFGPNVPPPAGYTGGYVSFGIPTTGASAAGVYGPPGGTATSGGYTSTSAAGAAAAAGGHPVVGGVPSAQPAPGTAGQHPSTSLPPLSSAVGPAAAAAGHGAASGLQSAVPAAVATTGGSTDWAAAYFASFGLPADVANKVNQIFQKYPDTNEAIQFALALIRGTPWYQQTFPGIQYGMQHGLISDEQSYRQYVIALDTLSQQYWGRHISGNEVSSYLYQGLTPEIVGKQYEGLANVTAYGKDYNYLLSAFSGEGQQSTDNLRALGEEQSGLDTPLGQRLQRALSQATQRYQTIFQGQAATPSLSLGKTGLSAPSLLGGNTTPDVAA